MPYLMPADPTKPATHWLTYRKCDAEPGSVWPHRDGRFLYHWNPDWQAWRADDDHLYVCMHTNNGWRIES